MLEKKNMSASNLFPEKISRLKGVESKQPGWWRHTCMDACWQTAVLILKQERKKKNAYKRLEQTNLHAQLHLQTKLCSKLNFSTMEQRKLESQAQLQDDSYNPRDIEGLHWISSLIIIKIKRAWIAQAMDLPLIPLCFTYHWIDSTGLTIDFFFLWHLEKKM